VQRGGDGSAALVELLEREEALAAAAATVSRAGEGAGGLLLVRGHAGVGKSAFLRAVEQGARARGVKTLAALGSELERDFGFGVAVQLFGTELATGTASRRDALLAGPAQLAEPVFSAGAVGDDAPSLFPLLHGLHWLTTNVAGDGPLLLAIDDLHWADEPSLQFLLYLLQRIDELPVAVVATFRPAEPGSSDLLDRLSAHARTEPLDLEPLTEAGVTQAIRRDHDESADPEFCRACAKVTGGNPFLLVELLCEAERRGIPARADSVDRVLELTPDSLTRQIVVRLARLPDAAAAVARAASIAGDGAPPGLVSALAGVDHEAARAALDALAAANILEQGEPIRFVHPLVRAAIYADLGSARRAGGHLRAGEILREWGTPPERTAAQLVHAERAGRRWVVETLQSAAAAASSRGAAEIAVRYLERARNEPPPPDLRTAVLVEAGRAELAAGVPTAEARLREAIDSSTDPRERAEIHLHLGRALYFGALYGEAVDAFTHGLAELDGHDPDLAIQLEAERGVVDNLPGMRTLDPSEARLGDILQRPPDGLTLAERAYMASVALVRLFGGDPSCLDLAWRAYGDGALLEQETSDGTALYGITSILHRTGLLDEADSVLSAAVADARRRGSVMGFAMASYARSPPRLHAGRIVEAIADAEAALDAQRYGWRQFAVVAYAALIECHIERGDLEAAESAASELPEGWAGTSQAIAGFWARGHLDLARGRPREALEEYSRWRDAVPGIHPVAYAGWRSSSALALVQLGERDEALRLATEEVDLCRAFGSDMPLGVALRALGAASEGAERVGLLRESAGCLARTPARLESCRTGVALGTALRHQGERAEAREVLRAALDSAEQMGARALASRASDELAIAGARPRRRPPTGIDSLTPSESRVAELAARGLTNREIAQALFVTIKAVEGHLRNTYRKLEISKRAELPEALEPKN
jgi:DNA-binding CsgD family transcriptional regulator